MAPIRRCSSLLLAAVLVATLSSCDDSPTSPGDVAVPSIVGTYSSPTWYRVTLTQISTGSTVTGTCRGSLTISSQNGPSFSGSFIRRRCEIPGLGVVATDVISGNVTQGTVRPDGGVSFDLVVPGSDPGSLLALGCVTTSSDSLYAGAVTGRTLSATRNVTLSCSGLGAVSAQIRVRGTR